MDSGSDDWIYWHFFTITLKYNNSYIKLLLNDVSLTNLYEESRIDLSLLNAAWRISDWSLLFWIRVRVRVRVALRMAVYRQSVRLGAKPFETHGQNFIFNWTLAVIVLIQHPLWREDGVVSYEYAWSYNMLLKILLLLYIKLLVLFETSLWKQSHLYASLTAIYWAHRAICIKCSDFERYMNSSSHFVALSQVPSL
jgi:hypothetical protein